MSIDGLVLRSLAPDDAAAVTSYRLANREYHRRFNIGLPPAEEPAIRAWLEASIQLDFGVRLGGDLVGICSLGLWRTSPAGSKPVPPEDGGADLAGIGYDIDERHSGKGYATAAGRALVEYAFCRDGVRRIQVPVARGNAPSRRVLEKIGFSLEREQVGLGSWDSETHFCIYLLHRKRC